MADVTRPKTGHLWMATGGLALAIMLYFAYMYPREQIGPVQPIYFSHRIHAGVKQINCRFCHPYVERSRNAGLPSVQKCFYCHNWVIPNHPQIQVEKQHLETNTPVPWKRIFYLPDFVFFRHQPHVLWRGLDCSNCHGDVKSQDRLQRVDFQMGFCLNCHRKMSRPGDLKKRPLPAYLDCWLACHR